MNKHTLLSGALHILTESSIENDILKIPKKSTDSLIAYLEKSYVPATHIKSTGEGYRKYFKAVLDELEKRNVDMKEVIKKMNAGYGDRNISFKHYKG